GEAVDLLFERHDLVAGLAKCGGQPLVLRVDRRQARLEEGHLTSHVGRLTARASAPVFEAIVVRSHLAPPRKGVVYSQTLQSQASFATHVINDWPEGDFRRGTNVSNRPRRSGPPAPGVAVEPAARRREPSGARSSRTRCGRSSGGPGGRSNRHRAPFASSSPTRPAR